jgi:Icc-related predicted phosphoesterase
MKILYVTDLHGHHSKYKKTITLAKEHRVDAIINGGDMFPKNGNLFEQDQFITGSLKKHFAACADLGIHYLCYPGNDDLKTFDALFDDTCKQFSNVHNIAQRKIEIADFEFIGMNWVTDYPFRLKDRCYMDSRDYLFQKQFGSAVLSESGKWREIDDWFAYAKTLPTIEDEMAHLVLPKNMDKAVYVIHMPPAMLGLDKCANGDEVGSRAIYAFIEKHQPLFTLHGHIHESPQMTGKWFAELGRTVCIQPGQPRELSCVVLDLKERKYERLLIAP